MRGPVRIASGEDEALKGSFHAATAVLALLMAGYGFLAFAERREPHLLVNGALYSALTVFEAFQVRHHLRDAHQR